MQVTARVDYALRAVIGIGRHGGVMRKSELAAGEQIPSRFLEQILAELVRSGILIGSRGPSGGYQLARPASEITVADVVRAIDGPLAGVRGTPPEELDYPQPSAALRGLWVALRASMRAVLEETTIANLVDDDLPADVRDLLDQPGAWKRR